MIPSCKQTSLLLSQAQDLSQLVVALIRDFPEHYALYSQKEFRYNNITQANRNRLLWLDPTVDGVKTGFTDNAGYCLITSARRGERRLVSVVLGTASESARATESQKLLNWGFQFFDSVKLYARNQPVTQLRVWKGSSDMLKAGFTSDLYLALPKGQSDKIKASVESLQPRTAGGCTGSGTRCRHFRPHLGLAAAAVQVASLTYTLIL